ncbi:hypothetical protein K445DRAFT_195005 [Daldinia sp. EC12]|nr:hypothetical protein K445DRAFT_195005 [Daldinia sp. EC12]
MVSVSSIIISLQRRPCVSIGITLLSKKEEEYIRGSRYPNSSSNNNGGVIGSTFIIYGRGGLIIGGVADLIKGFVYRFELTYSFFRCCFCFLAGRKEVWVWLLCFALRWGLFYSSTYTVGQRSISR